MDACIASPEELAVLVTLVDSPSKWWDPDLVSRELGMTTRLARAVLDRFAAANLLDIRVTDDVRYQFRPGTAELQQGVMAFAAAYRSTPAAVVQRLAQSAGRGVRDFADAFRLRRP